VKRSILVVCFDINNNNNNVSYSKQACGDGLPRKPSMVANYAIVQKYKIKELLSRKQRQKKNKDRCNSVEI